MERKFRKYWKFGPWVLTLVAGLIVLTMGWNQKNDLAANSLPPTSARPSDANFRANPHDYNLAMSRLAAQAGKPCDMIFIGASVVQRWNSKGGSVWNNYYEPRHALNFGVSGDRTENVLWRLDHMNLSGLKPKVAVIFIGLNNRNSAPWEVALGIDAVVKKTQLVFPGVKVLVVSLTPHGPDQTPVVKTNELLRSYADNRSVYYVDLYSHLPREGNNWKGLGSDRFHLSAEGYEIWAEQMEPLLNKILPLAPATASYQISSTAGQPRPDLAHTQPGG